MVETEIDQDKPWPTTSQSGSKSATNFYKNHRGLSPSGQAICGGQSNFGETTEACDSSYVTFTHSYVCSAAEVRALQQSGRTCQLDGSGRLVNSPCTGGSVPQAEGKCIFQPRVHVKDNWGWCTGSCPGGADGTGGCYEDTSEDIRNLKKDECNITLCPGDTCLSEGGRDGSQNNPWINFDGYIRIDPKKL